MIRYIEFKSILHVINKKYVKIVTSNLVPKGLKLYTTSTSASSSSSSSSSIDYAATLSKTHDVVASNSGRGSGSSAPSGSQTERTSHHHAHN